MSEITDLHAPLARWLREQKLEYVRARSDRRSTIEAGWPDLTILHPQRFPLLIELKTDKGDLSRDQKETHARLRERGFRVHVIRELDKAILLIEAWRDGVGEQPPISSQRPKFVQWLGCMWEERNGQLFKTK